MATPNEIILKAQKKVKTKTTGIDWNSLYAEIIDEIFTFKPWRFARKEINYTQPQQTFDYQFNHTPEELALNKPISAYYTLQFAIGGGGTPTPTSNTSHELVYYPYSDFISDFPDHSLPGMPKYITIITDNDGTNGLHIGTYPQPTSDMATWIYGDFIPSYTINDLQMPILPVQFHSVVSYGIIREAADELGQETLSMKYGQRFSLGIARMDDWDRRNPIYKPRLKPYGGSSIRKGPFLPPNYPVGWSR
jgi:hypothetical protein